MITDKELQAVELSPCHRDFYQVWNELIETADKISKRWSPASTNESDPGIVLLKVLTAVADKLNYQIDKNTLEAFMPSASQEEAMRKLCDMMGYSMKYYQSATCPVTISYIKDEGLGETDSISIPRFTNITNSDNDINYITLNEIILTSLQPAKEVDCIEGELVECETNDDNIISMLQLDDNQRYYLPETQIAENGIFVTNVDDNAESELWLKVDNLNTQVIGSKIYKFGFDSKKGLPYIQFPEDIGTIIEDGLKIKYIRTSGINGNIVARVLSVAEITINEEDGTTEKYTKDDFSAVNTSSATNGADLESINDTYNNYKKTIGTFDTLVTCRDYMNKIYQLVESDTDSTPLVSNVVVSDIRDDINRAVTLCSFNEYGICYNDMSLRGPTPAEIYYDEEVDTESGIKCNSEHLGRIYKCNGKYYKVIYNSDEAKYDKEKISGTRYQNSIEHFDLVLYPFKTVTSLNTKAEYINSFKYDDSKKLDIEADLEDYKTISHNFTYPNSNEITCIKNYLKLNAKITTNKKVNTIEEASILSSIYTNIYKNFNARKMDFGEEIPFDTILETIQNADTRIKNVSLDEPILYTKFQFANGTEYDTVDTSSNIGKQLYNKFALRNVLAGRIPLFKYNESFKPEYTEKKYPSYSPVYPDNDKKIKLLKSKANLDTTSISEKTPITLLDNEAIQFRLQNLKTTVTYPAYVNYFIKLTNTKTKDAKDAVAAQMKTIATFMTDDYWVTFANNDAKSYLISETYSKAEQFNTAKNTYGKLFIKDDAGDYTIKDNFESGVTYYHIPFNETTFSVWYKFITDIINSTVTESGYQSTFYRVATRDMSLSPGYLVDSDHAKYKASTTYISIDPLNSYYVQNTYNGSKDNNWGLGCDAEYSKITKDAEYELKENEYLLINYTESSGDDSSSKNIVNIYYGPYTIIKPNFSIIDSASKKEAGSSYSKTTGFDFVGKAAGVLNPAGMFTLGANEQIEIREKVEVLLDDSLSYIYWELANEETIEGTTITFPFENNRYILKEGEYFYYTNSAKTDLAYYGAGTEIERSGASIELKKNKTDTTLTADDIATNGLAAAIPWQVYNFDKTKHLTLKEYQYITLAKDDKLNTITLKSENGVNTDSLDNTWKKCEKANYTLNDTTSNLPSVNISDLCWEVRSRLDFNMSPTTSQTLYSDRDSISLYSEISGGELIKELKPKKVEEEVIPLSLKSNYLCQDTGDTKDVRVTIYNSDGTASEHIDDFSIKLCKKEDVVDSKGININLNNFGTYWTKLSLKKPESGEIFKTTLNTIIPDKHIGLIIFYYMDANTTISDYASISLKPETGTLTPMIFNNDSKWWTGYDTSNYAKPAIVGEMKTYNKEDDFKNEAVGKKYIKDGTGTTPGYLVDESRNKYRLAESGDWKSTSIDCYDLKYLGDGPVTIYHFRPGINIVRIDGSSEITIRGDAKGQSTLAFGNLDIIPLNEDASPSDNVVINPRLDYFDIAGNGVTKQILSDLKSIDQDHNFYYNAIIENSLAIDLNTYVDDDSEDAEKLSTPTVWYDYNNINNKFVISEIDAEYLPYGVTLAKNSRL